MKKMFYKCKSLNTIELSDFNTSNVTNMSGMFGECPGLTSLDLSTFNTCNVTDMSYMFYGCSSLSSVNLSSFNMNNVTNMSQMFDGCSNLEIVDLSKHNDSGFEYIILGLGRCDSLDNIVYEYNNNDMEQILIMIPDKVRVDFKFKDQEINNFINKIQYNFRIKNIKHEGCKYKYIRLELRNKEGYWMKFKYLNDIDRYYARILYENMFI